MDIMNSFSSRLKLLRDSNNLSQSELGDLLGVSRGSISFYEKAERVPDIEFLVKTANYFDVSLDYLVGKTDAETDDKDIQFICDYTGLSEEAVNNLHEYRNDSDTVISRFFEYSDNRYLDFINYLLAFDIMDADVLFKVNEYKRKIKFYSDSTDITKGIIDTIIQSINSKETTNTYREISDRYFQQAAGLRDTERNCRIDYIECVDAFEKILSEFVKPEKEELEAKIKQCKKDLNGIRHQVLSMEDTNADNNKA